MAWDRGEKCRPEQPFHSAAERGIGYLKALLQIAKVPVCALITLSALAGFFLALPQAGTAALLAGSGIFLLACGAASLNSVQERRHDTLMQRTVNRPLPQGRIGPGSGLLQAAVCLVAGLVLLACSSGSPTPVWLGIGSVVLYNFIYTPLKARTAWAIVPGALCGALPPYIGWQAAGGAPRSAVILALCLLLVVWQIPHFWLIMLRHGDDYRLSRFPNILRLLSERSLRRLLAVWLLTLPIFVHLLLAVSVQVADACRWTIGVATTLLALFSVLRLLHGNNPDYRELFLLINGLMLITLTLLIVGSFIQG